MSDEVRVEDGEHARTVVIDRPRTRNALTVGTVEALAAAVRGAPATGAGAVIITGAPPAFCAGGDLPSLSAIAEEGSLMASDAIYTGFHGLVRAIRDCPLPVIAAINGPALGAGLDLALVCDLRLAAPDAVFESTWIKVGLVPGMGGAHHLPHIVGSARAAEMLLCGRRLTATEALDWGLVSQVTGEGELLDAARSMAAGLAKLPAVAVARTKAALRRAIDAGLDDELAVLGAQQGQLLTAEPFRRVVERFGAANGRKGS